MSHPKKLNSDQVQHKISMKILIEETKYANFKSTFSTITSNHLKLESNNAVKLVVALCNACHLNTCMPENINERDLSDLIKCLLQLIHVPSNETYTDYIQSVYHILKFLIQKKSFDCIMDLQEMFVPEFMPSELTDKHYNVYHIMCKTIFNVIVKLNHVKEKSDIALQLCYLLTKIYKKLKTNNLLEGGHKCMVALKPLISSKELLAFYQNLNSLDIIVDETLYPLFIKNFSLLHTQLVEKKDFNLATKCFEITSNQFKLFKKSEFATLWKIMEILEWTNPGNVNDSKRILNESYTALKDYYRKCGLTSNLQLVCDVILSAACVTLQLYKQKNDCLKSIETHSVYYKFLNDISSIMSNSNMDAALRILNIIGSLGRSTIVNQHNVTRNYKKEILRYLEKFLKFLSNFKQDKYWYDVGSHLYTIGMSLHKEKDTEMSILYLEKFIQSFFEFDTTQSCIIGVIYLNTAFDAISDSYFESQDYEKSLLVNSLSIILTDSPKSGINRWLRTKSAARESTIDENQLQELTLITICDKLQSEINLYYPKSLVLDNERKIELLLCELREYNAKWKSKIPMSSVFKELRNIGNAQLCAEVFIEIWGDADKAIHENIPKLLQDTIKKLEVEEINQDTLLAHLYYLQHKYRVKDTILKHCDEMERTMNMTKSNEVIIGVPQDPNDECDIISSYESLQFSRYLNMMKELNKSLELLHKYFSNKTVDEIKEKNRLYKLLTNIAHEYSLHGYMTQAIQAWNLAIQIAGSINSLYKLQATGFLIELSDVRKPLLQKLMLEAEKNIADLKSDRKFEELIVYFLCKAQAYFYVDFDEAYGAFRQALKLHEEFQGNRILQAKIYLMHYKFIVLPCKFQVEGHQEYSLVKVYQAVTCANAFYGESAVSNAYDLRIFFEVYETIAKMYHDLRLPRELRCYAKSAIIIAQEMLLPLRTSSFLYYLAYADIYSYRLDDCRMKVNDFSEMLCLTKSKHLLNTPHQARSREKLKDIVDNLASDFNEMMLDVPGRPLKSSSTGSPSFASETFKFPSFFNHDETCECFYCTSLEYHQFVLKKMYLDALLHVYEENLKVAKDFFVGCVKIYEFLKKNQEIYLKKISKRVSQDLIPQPRDSLAEIYCLTLLEYGNFLIRGSRLESAKKNNKKLLDLLEIYNLQFIHLYNEALVQKLNIIMKDAEIEESLVKMTICNDERSEVISVTPDNKSSKIFILPSTNPPGTVEKIKKVIPKSLIFDLTEAEDEDGKNLLAGAKTPALLSSKMKIPNTKTIKKADIPSTKSSDAVKVKNVVSTPISIKVDPVDNYLASRTKLLTERLKNSSRKGSSSSVTDENSKSAVRANVRQNLLSQLDDAELEKGGVVRRSARNKK